MAAIEKLLTMGLAHGIDPRRMLLGALAGGSTDPDVGKITWEDITQAVVTLRPDLRAVLYLKCAPQLASGNELAALTNRLWADLVAYDRRHYTYRPKEVQAGLQPARQATFVRVALAEYMDPRTCRRCQGTGQVLDRVVGKGMVKGTCGLCEGHGYRDWSDRRRARECDVDRHDWAKRWDPSYSSVLRSATGLYREAASGFKAVLFGDENAPAGTPERRRATDRVPA